MSAQGRGAVREMADAYITPTSLARAIVLNGIGRRWFDRVGGRDVRILEASAGTGTFVRALKEAIACHVTAVEINPAFREKLKRAGADKVIIGDFLEYEAEEPFDLVIGNPPYNEAEEHIRHQLRCVASHGRTSQLLRLNFLGSGEREDFWANYVPSTLDVVSPRPSFWTGKHTPVLNKHGKKGSDATEYAVFSWLKTSLLVPEKRHVVTSLGRINWVRKAEDLTAGRYVLRRKSER